MADDANIDAGKLIQKLIEKNGQLTLDNAVKEVLIEDLQQANHMLTAALQRISDINQQGEASEEVNEVPVGPDPGVGIHGGIEPGLGGHPDGADHGGDGAADPDLERGLLDHGSGS